MLRHVSSIPERFEVKRVDFYSDAVLDSWVMEDPLEIMKLVDVEPGSIDYANGLEMMVEGYSSITGPARAGGTIYIEPVGHIDLVPEPHEPVIELDHYASGAVSVRLNGMVWQDYGLLDVYAAWRHYTYYMTDYERARARDAAMEWWDRPIEEWGPQGIFRRSYDDWGDAPIDGLVEDGTEEVESVEEAQWDIKRWTAHATEPALRYFVQRAGSDTELDEAGWYEAIGAATNGGKTVELQRWVSYNQGNLRAIRTIIEEGGDDQ